MPPLTCLLTTATVWPLITMTALASPALEYEVLAMLKDDSIGDPAADILPGMEKTGDSELDWEWREFERPSIGDDGVMVFRAVGSTSFREGIWATDIDGTLFKVVEKGDYMMLRGKVRRVEELRLNHGSSRNDFREQAINAHGQVIYSIRTEDEFSFLIRAQIPFPKEATELSVVDEAGTIRLEMPTRVCHSYQLETARDLAGSWEESGDPVVGDGKPLRFAPPTDLEDDARFFRVRISPIEYLPSIQ